MLERLKEYKELIAIVTFFLGGFFWLQTHFPSKSDLKPQLASIHCLLDSYMRLTQLQISSQDLEKQLSTLGRQLSEAPGGDISGSGLAISPAMRAGIEQLKSDYTAKRNELGKTTAEMAKIRDELARAVCGRVEL